MCCCSTVKMFSDFGHFVMEKCRKELGKTLDRDAGRKRQCYIASLKFICNIKKLFAIRAFGNLGTKIFRLFIMNNLGNLHFCLYIYFLMNSQF